MTPTGGFHEPASDDSCPPISIAGFKDVYRVPRVEEALTRAAGTRQRASEALRATYVRMIRTGGQRFVIKPSALPDIDAPDRRTAELRGAAGGHPQATGAVFVVGRSARTRTDPAARRPGHRQDPLRAPAREAARHRLQLHRHEFADRGLDPVRCVGAVEERQAGQGVRCAGQWRLCQPGDRRRRDRQGGRRQRNTTRSAACTRCSSTTPRATSSTNSPRCRSTPPTSSGSRRRTTRASIPEPILNRMNVYAIEPPDEDGARRIAQSIYDELRNEHAWGRAFPRTLNGDSLDRLGAAETARDAARDARGVRQRQARQSQ